MVAHTTHSRFQWFENFAADLRARRGWQRYVLAAAYGALNSLAYSPADIVPVLWIAFPALIFLLQEAGGMRRAFAIGWCFAFGFFVFDLYWTAVSMFVDIQHFWWAVPLAAFGLPAVFAIYYGIAAALAQRIGLRGVTGVIGFVLLWFLADDARGHLFTGFPWNIEGYVWADFLPVLQITSVIGVYGLTLLTLLAACLPACLAGNISSQRHRALVMGSLAMFGLIAVWGAWRVMEAPVTAVPDVRLRLVQPDISQQIKWQPQAREDNFRHLLALSSAKGEKPVTAILWPETASPFYLTLDEEHRRAAAGIIPEKGALITGVLRADSNPSFGVHYYNSLIAVGHNANVTAIYDKSHLVPFGEYMPFRRWIPAPALAGLGIDFSHGAGPETLHVSGLPPFSPMICYEAIFPGAVVDRHNPPQFLVNVTNDGWYGNTAGPYQHFAIAQVRAVEEGLPLVRVANTGISGIIDAYGRIETRLGLGESGFIDGDLPKALPAPTFFSRHSEALLWLIFASLALRLILGMALGIKR